MAIIFLQSVYTCAGQSEIEDIDYENNMVYVGIWLNNIYSYEYTAGDYTIDLFLYFFWVDPNIKTIDWILTNGYTVNPATTNLESSNLTSEVKYEIYRVTGVFSTSPDAKNYPFDSIKLGVGVELLTHDYDIELAWLENQTGLDPRFKNAGWVTTNLELSSTTHSYPLGVELPRAEMVVTQQRQLWLYSFQDIIPPMIFAIVSAFSFFFKLRDATAVGLRLGLNTSMLVTTLLFYFTVNAGVPPSSTITLYDMFIFSVMIFIVMNLVVTITGYVQFFHFKNELRARTTNRWGFIPSLVVPSVFFLLMYILRG